MNQQIWDTIVIGSGPSGGRIAADLTKSGAQVLLLEAGRHYTAKDFPLPEITASSKMFWGGGVELNQDARLGFLRAKVVGGTSIVNQALLDRFDDLVWSDWSDLTGISFSSEQMASAYAAVEQSMNLEYIPEKYFGKNTQLFVKAFEKKGLGWTPLRRGQKDCGLGADGKKGNDCIACLGGCPRASKQSTLVTSIEPALKSGLKLVSLCEAQSIQDYQDHKIVNVEIQNPTTKQKTKESFKCRTLVIAAGSFGSTQLLLKSQLQARLPALGKNLSCHPQYMTYGLFNKNQTIDAFKGAFQAVKSNDPKLRQQGLKFENVFAPPIATAMLMTGFGKKHHQQMKNYRHLASMEVAIRDSSEGEMKILGNGKVQINKSLTSEDQNKLNMGMNLISEMLESIGAEKIIRCQQAFGLHLMGGCQIGIDSKKSVVNPEFQVHDHKGIFIADSSLFPSAPGLNPSLTVMAFSHQAVPFILKETSK